MRVDWQGFEFDVYLPLSNWSAKPGLYIFVGWDSVQRLWRLPPLYIGKTDSFLDRLPNHEKWPEAARQGATHVHLLVMERADLREEIEKALIEHYQPTLNDRHKD